MLKPILSLILTLYSLLNATAQWVSIPDTNFGTTLNSQIYSQCLQGNNTVGWQLDTTCPFVLGATIISCNNSNIRSIEGVQYFKNITHLSCSGNHIDSLPTLPTTLNSLFCDINYLTYLPALPASLTYLNCSGNYLSSLPTLPAQLSGLNCNVNLLTNLPTLPALLTSLSCTYNQLSSLPVLPLSLNWLHCDHNQLTSLPVLPPLLTYLPCNNNQLSSLPPLPASLTELLCNDNQLTDLPALPPSLAILRCDNNQLTNLPPLPSSLKTLHCGYNQLTSVPALPSSLTVLMCFNNQLTNLPSLPATLTRLDCFDNLLTNIPALPTYLTVLSCGNNQLTSLTSLSDSLEFFTCHNNPALTCLPTLNKIKRFFFWGTSVTCLPNYPQNNYDSNPDLNTVPLCTNDMLTNPNSCLVINSADNISEVNYSLYPNPATHQVSVTFEQQNLDAPLIIKDYLGCDVYNSKASSSTNTIDIADFRNGIYFVSVGSYVKKLIVQK